MVVTTEPRSTIELGIMAAEHSTKVHTHAVLPVL